ILQSWADLAADLGLVLESTGAQLLRERAVAHDRLQLNVFRVEELETHVVVAVLPVHDEACDEEPELVQALDGAVDVLDSRDGDVGIDDVDVPGEEAPHAARYLRFPFAPARDAEEAERLCRVVGRRDRVAGRRGGGATGLDREADVLVDGLQQAAIAGGEPDCPRRPIEDEIRADGGRAPERAVPAEATPGRPG